MHDLPHDLLQIGLLLEQIIHNLQKSLHTQGRGVKQRNMADASKRTATQQAISTLHASLHSEMCFHSARSLKKVFLTASYVFQVNYILKGWFCPENFSSNAFHFCSWMFLSSWVTFSTRFTQRSQHQSMWLNWIIYHCCVTKWIQWLQITWIDFSLRHKVNVPTGPHLHSFQNR